MAGELPPPVLGAFRTRMGGLGDGDQQRAPLHQHRGGTFAPLPSLTVTRSFPAQLPEKRIAQSEASPSPVQAKAPRLAPPLQPVPKAPMSPQPAPPPLVAPPPPPRPAAFPVWERTPRKPQAEATSVTVPGEDQDELAFCSTQYLSATVPKSQSSQSPQKNRPSERNFWGLPDIVRDIYRKRGISELYAWQSDCLNNDKVMTRGRNLVFSVPTSGGKTLPAEIHLMRTVHVKEKKALLVLPLLEKARSMSVFGKELRFPIEPYYGSNGPIPAPAGKGLAICTIEKANTLVNQMIEDKRLDEIGLVVVDELHMVGEPDRGAVLELLLAKIMHAGKGNIQIIGMSATTGNSLHELARWLGAEIFEHSFRPVPLSEYYVVEGDVHSNQRKLVRRLGDDKKMPVPQQTPAAKPAAARKMSVDEALFRLVDEIVPQNCVLVFCCTKKETQDVAERLYQQLGRLEKHREDDKIRLLEHMAAELGVETDRIDGTLRKTLLRGIAFHHSGLSSIERELIETAFLKREVCILTCTSTLAAGVNLPAKRVILRGAKTGQVPLTVRKYMQMVGRAGRAGMESEGESFLLLNAAERKVIDTLVGQPPEALVSSLRCPPLRGTPHEQRQHDEDTFQRLVSDGICGGYIATRDDVKSFMQCTLGWQQGAAEIHKKAEGALDLLASTVLQYAAVTVDENSATAVKSTQYAPTPLAKAAHRSNFVPRESRLIFDELTAALDCICLSDPLHRLYLITPLHSIPEPVWTMLPSLVEKMSDLRKATIQRIGLSNEWLNIKEMQVHMGKGSSADPESMAMELRARRLWCAWLLSLVLEKDHDLDAVIAEYSRVWRRLDFSHFDQHKVMERGVLEILVESSSGFGHALAGLCKRYSAETKASQSDAERRLSPVWAELEILLLRLSKQLNHGVKEEELELVEIHGVKKARARKLFAAGYRSVSSVARAKVEEMVVRVKFGPYAEGIAKRIIEAAKALLLAKATAMKEQAAELLQGSDMEGIDGPPANFDVM